MMQRIWISKAVIILMWAFVSCSAKTEEIAEKLNYDREMRILFERSFVNGLALYKINCANCHQENGTGLAKLIPPLANSDFLKNNLIKSACIIRYGVRGFLKVNETVYNQPMPANANLTNSEISEILTYVDNEWGGQRGLVNISSNTINLDSCLRK